MLRRRAALVLTAVALGVCGLVTPGAGVAGAAGASGVPAGVAAAGASSGIATAAPDPDGAWVGVGRPDRILDTLSDGRGPGAGRHPGRHDGGERLRRER